MLTIQGVAALALVLLAAAEWCGTARMERLAEQQSLERAELKQFHASLVANIQNLAEQSGMLTSADLCPVRFRFRFDTGAGFPQPPRIDATLIRPGPPAERLFPQFNPATATAHFGLVPPGKYRLNVRLYGSFELNHDFDVLPGVPVDRLVLCPTADIATATVTLDVSLPASLRERGLVFLAHLCRDSLTIDRWNWSPIDPGGTPVVAAPSESEAHQLAQALWSWGTFNTRAMSSAPYTRCRLTSLIVFQFDETKSKAPTELVSFRFMDAAGLPPDIESPSSQTVILEQPSPRYQGDFTVVPPHWRWTIDLPSTARELLEDRLRVSTKVEAARSEPMPL